MRGITEAFRVALIFVAMWLTLAATPALAGEATLHDSFSNLSANAPHRKSFYVYHPGRIEVNVRNTAQNVTLTIALRRPNGTEAGRIMEAASNLTLTYAATPQEVAASITAASIKWTVEVSRSPGSGSVGGKLIITYPWDVVEIVKPKEVVLGPLGNVPVNQYTRSEPFRILAPGRIRVKAVFLSPNSRVKGMLIHNTVGTVIDRDNESSFEVSHAVSEQDSRVPAWNWAMQNLRPQAARITLGITFVPDR